ncbi:MAG: selenium metabolism-associated LysR family transcriptional regulator [Desulfosudaceae bacterium]
MVDLWHLTIFKQVVETGGFSSAGRAINLTQPTVSNHIKELESHFNCRLLDRIGKTTRPTRAGELLYAYAGKLLSLYDETETAMSGFLGNIQDRLTVDGSTIPASYILPRMIGGFLKQYQNVRISLSSGDTSQIVNDLLEYRLELGVVGARAEHKRVSQQKLTRDEMRLIVPADHEWAGESAVDPDRLCRAPFIARESGSGTRQSLQSSLAGIGLDISSLRVVAEFGSTASVIQGIKNGVGLSILSPVAVADELASGSLKALVVTGLDLSRYFYLTTHRDRTPSPLGEAFIKFLSAGFPE